ncbi:MAG: ROK family protein [Candidatus Limnocylindria bacterium]
MTDRLIVGIDVGGSKVAGAALDAETNAVRAMGEQQLNGEALDVQVVALARSLLVEAHGEAGSLAALGVVVPGQVDADSGVIRLAVNLGAGELAIGALVAAAVGVPCFVEHDARAVVAWLHATGHGPYLAYLSVGTGISAGVVVNGIVIRGADGLAGEIGHTVADAAGPRCVCGLDGCLEAVASGPAVARAAREAMAEGRRSSMRSTPETAEVYRAAAAGDSLATEIAERAAGHLARAVRGLALGFGVPRIVIGGGVSRAGRPFRDPLMAAIERERVASPLVHRAIAHDAIEILDDARPVGALGAAAVARRGIGAGLAEPGREVGTR